MKATIAIVEKLRPIAADMEPGAPFALVESPTHVLSRVSRASCTDPSPVSGTLMVVVIASAEDGSHLDTGALIHISCDAHVLPLRLAAPIAFLETDSTHKE